ncbi:MAG TPA: DUF4834 family protein [Puia sp.]|nr:DUF4834 family protein [Puia sp.]
MMPLSEIFFLGIVLYLLYGFIFNFILPIFRTTKHVRQQFRNMQDPNVQGQANPFQQFNARNGGGQASQDRGQQNGPQQNTASPGGSPSQKPRTDSKNKMGEYIDFEEIK